MPAANTFSAAFTVGITEDKGMSPSRLSRVSGRLAGLMLALFTSVAAALPPSNMPRGVTEISHEVYDLHMLIFWICVAIGVVVFGVMLYSIIRHRKSKGFKAAQFHESTAVEILWTIVPFVILIAMAIPATQTLIAMEDTSDSDMTVKITGYQWQWHYDYLDHGISFYSHLATPREHIYNQAEKGNHYLLEVDKELVLPVGQKIHFLLTSNDVIHSWWVPALGFKKDAVPGFINGLWTEINKPGVYRGQCGELCGRDHAFMPIVVRAVEQAKFDKWVQAQKGGNKQGGRSTADSGTRAADNERRG
jgi:cytochrome c oxidase subunit II